MSIVKLDLPDPLTPVMQVKVPSGMLAVTFCRLFARAPWTVMWWPLPLRRTLRDRDLAPAGEVVGGERVLRLEHLFERALRDDLAPVDAGAGAKVYHVVGGADRVLVMLDDYDRVAEVAQALERFEQPVVVALVEADTRLVEHVEHARQPAADLAGEANALALAAAERAAGAVEVEVIEPDVVEEAQPLVDLFQDRAGDLVLGVGELVGEAQEPVLRRSDAHLGGSGDVGGVRALSDLHRERLVVEALAMAHLARLRGLVLAQLLAHPRALGLQHPAVEVADHPLERLAHGVFLAPVLEGERDGLALRAEQDDVLVRLAQFVPRGGEVEAVFPGERVQDLHVVGRRRVGLRPGHHRALL